MKEINQEPLTPAYAREGFILYNENNLQVMGRIPDNSVDMVFADPPYMISKADWDISKGFDADAEFHGKWIAECRRILKPEGTIWVTGTHHSIHQCGFLLQKNDFKILNDISWYKPHEKRDIYRRVFVPAHETILWARKDKDAMHFFNYYAMRGGYFPGDILKKRDESMQTVWSIMPRTDAERRFGTHPTQKPLALLKRIILASTKPGAVILDPFNGGGTTGIAAASIGNRTYIGCDLNREYIDLTILRYEALMHEKAMKNSREKDNSYINREKAERTENISAEREREMEEMRRRRRRLIEITR